MPYAKKLKKISLRTLTFVPFLSLAIATTAFVLINKAGAQSLQAVSVDFTVTNVTDSGAGSLRQAMLDANAHVGADRIVFNIPGVGIHTINLTSGLPTITEPVVIDGSTQPGFSVGHPQIELNGVSAGAGVHGITISSGGSTVRGLVINRFEGSGISLLTNANNHIEGNFIGLDPAGTSKQPNKQSGISISDSAANVIGGTTAAARNVISGNTFSGISLTSPDNVIQGNFLGTNATGTAEMGNDFYGIDLINTGSPSGNNLVGGTTVGASNLISGNQQGGINLNAPGVTVQGNLIGTDILGTSKVPNGNGIQLRGNNCVIGGTTVAARNVISGNNGAGINLDVTTVGPISATVQGNYIGTDITGTLSLGNGAGLNVTGKATIGGIAAGAGNLISGNTGPGLQLSGGTENATVLGNLIGTNVTGDRALPNLIGISVQSASNVIGGAQAGARNVVSGNVRGIEVGGLVTSGTGSNVIKGNFIGVNAANTGPLPNTVQGLTINDSNDNTVGGDQPGEGNVIAFNGRGVELTASSLNNSIRGNSIFSNGFLGIDLNFDDQVEANDQGDLDEGANHLQNFPVLLSITSAGGNTHIIGSLSSKANTQYRIDFYSVLACDVSGNGEGSVTLGNTQVTTNANGLASIDINLAIALPAGRTITATATDPLGNTSEFSPCDSSVTAGALEFSTANFNALEDVGNAKIVVVRTGGSKGQLTVNYSSADGSATAGTDYTAVSGTLTFADGDTQKIISLPVANDGIVESEETVQLTLSGTAARESLGSSYQTVLHIFDASTPLTILIDGQAFDGYIEGDLGAKNANIGVHLNAQTSRTVSFDYATTGITATANGDFVPVSGTLTFQPGTETQQIVVPILGDTLDENTEDFELALSNPVNASIVIPSVFVPIIDNDPLPQIAVNDVSVVEGAGANAVFTVELSAPSERVVLVNYATADSGATAGADYTSTSGTLTFLARETVKYVEVPILTDGAAESDEIFFMNLSAPFRATLADDQGVGTIIDAASNSSLVQFSAQNYPVNETNHQVSITVTRSGNSAGAATVDYRTLAQTASDRSDFTAAAGTIKFAAGETSKSFVVLITDDNFQEAAETLDLKLSNPTATSLGGPNITTVTITSNDATDLQSPVRPASFNTDFYVRQHYHDFLNREPDQAGLDFWKHEIDSCQNEPCRE
ncbi:MAG TPA: Calx-beta domain-containing protein, partial [Pyrinomonadaceae bacterium]|nr:Calx-beta domain-containing protein [Pyrinomonadaceae bacterium]